MKIISLEIDRYKIFQPKVELSLGKDYHVFIGVNGSGKSSILEAVALLFTTVKKYCIDGTEHERSFNFKIEFSFNTRKIIEESSIHSETHIAIQHVFLSSSRESGLNYTMAVDGKIIKKRSTMLEFLPDHLIFYYAGLNKNLEKIVFESEQQDAKKLNPSQKRKQANISGIFKKSITFIRLEHYPLLFLLNFIDREQKIPLSEQRFSIHTIVLHLKKPKDFSNTEYHNFYNLQGFLREYLDNLIPHSQPLEFDEELNQPLLIVEYHRGLIEAVENLTGLTEDERFNYTRYHTFHIVNLLFHIGILEKITVSLLMERGVIISIDDLSEGEQQLITIKSIKKVLSNENSLMLMDEPDAFLHPQRQRELLPYVIDIFSEDHNQIIATTHSPLVAQSIDFNHITVFDKSGHIINTKTKVLDTQAINKVLFGVEDRFSESVEEKFERFNDYKQQVFLNNDVNEMDSFRSLVNELQGLGEETEAIVNRELAQLKRLKNFDLFGKA